MPNVDKACQYDSGEPRLSVELSKERIGGLDFLRAIAVLLVLISHSGVSNLGALVLFDGGLGVESFFVISGFLITLLLLNETDREGRISLTAFYRRRAARLLPVFYAYLIVGVAYLTFRAKPVPWDAVWASSFYVINYAQAFNGAPTHYLSHCWSLAVEEQFYFLWPILLIFMLRRGWRLRRTLVLMVLGLWALKTVYVFVLDVSDEYLYRALETRGDQLAIGCLLAVLLRSETWCHRFQSLARFRWIPIASIFALLIVSTTTLRGSAQLKYLLGYNIEPVLVAILIPLIVLEAAQRGWLSRLINAQPIVLIGQISYGMYLFHPILMHPVRSFFENRGFLAAGVLSSVAVTILAAYISFNWFERPIRQRLTGHASRSGKLMTSVTST